ncbi:MAG TPA: amino acid ABC transporter permease [Aliidongia sp.]|nr:amino acid ABC transporter permease [Aliidongia sp.]
MGFEFQFEPIVAEWHLIFDGLMLTVWLSLGAIVLGSALAVVLTAARQLGGQAAKLLVEAYVELMRNTPFVVQLFLIFFGLSGLGVRLSAAEAALLAMTLNLAAYCAEIIRAGVDSIHKSQREAGLSLALTRRQVLQHVVLIPAIAKVWPALSSQFVLMMLASSICSFISAQELSGATAIVEQRTFRSFESYIVATTLYLLLALALKAVLGAVGRVAFPRVSGLARVQTKGEAA